MTHKTSHWDTLGAVFLVTGTCIGGGMLALPVATGASGLIPSSLLMILCWFAMTASALFLLEVNLWMKKGTHIMTMARELLGPVGQFIACVMFLFISYASLVAYTAAGGGMLSDAAGFAIGHSISKPMSCLLFLLLFGSAIYLGHRLIGRINTILFLAMVASYCLLVSSGFTEVKLSLLSHRNWSRAWLAIPLLLTTFSFHTMLPSVTIYLNQNIRLLRWAILGGTTLTLIIYLLWQIVVLGVVPVEGPDSLINALELGEPITQFLRHHIQNQYISWIAEFFSFFALVTSFIGIALGLFDFLSDSLKIKERGVNKLFLAVLIVIPTYFCAVYLERIFLLALDTSGGFGDSVLSGMLPALMVWMGRYRYRFPHIPQTPGGKGFIVTIFLFFLGTFLLETWVHLRAFLT